MSGVFVVFEPFGHSYLVVAAAAKRGFEVVVFHTLPISKSPPYGDDGNYISDAHPVSDWLKPAEVADLVDKALAGRKLVGTYCGPEITAAADSMVRQRHGLPHNDPEHVGRIVDKYWVRNRLREAGLTSLDCLDEEASQALQEWPKPGTAYFFKPRNGGGSAYVKKVRDLDQLREAAAEWDRDEVHKLEILRAFLKRGQGYFLEQEAKGELLSAEGLTSRGRYEFFGLTGRLLLASDSTIEVGSTFPREHPRLGEVRELAAAIHEALGYQHGPSHVEFMVPAEGPIEMVEFNPRLAGVDNLRLYNLTLGQNVEEKLIDLGCGMPTRVPEIAGERHGVMNYVFAPCGPGRLEALEFPEGAEFVRPFKSEGEDIPAGIHEFAYLAGFIVVSDTFEDSIAKAAEVRGGIRVNGVRIDENDINDVIVPEAQQSL